MSDTNLNEFIQDLAQCAGSAVEFGQRLLKDGEVDEALGVRRCDDACLG